jgi:hypothetical protein
MDGKVVVHDLTKAAALEEYQRRYPEPIDQLRNALEPPTVGFKSIQGAMNFLRYRGVPEAEVLKVIESGDEKLWQVVRVLCNPSEPPDGVKWIRPKDLDPHELLQQITQGYHRREFLAESERFEPPEPGEYFVRIVPRPGSQIFYVKFGVHYNLHELRPPLRGRSAVRCRRVTLGEDCPVCTALAAIESKVRRSQTQTEMQILESVRNSRARRRFVFDLVDMDDPETGVQIYDCTQRTVDLIRQLFRDWGDIAHPETGRVVRLTFEPWRNGLFCSSAVPWPDPEPIPVATWREDRHDLEAYAHAQLLTNGEMRALFEGQAKEEMTARM